MKSSTFETVLKYTEIQGENFNKTKRPAYEPFTCMTKLYAVDVILERDKITIQNMFVLFNNRQTKLTRCADSSLIRSGGPGKSW